MIDDKLAYEIGQFVIGVALMALWFGGPIAGGDYIGKGDCILDKPTLP